MPLADFDGVAHGLRRWNVRNVFLSGGEPFMRRDLGPICEKLLAMDFQVSLFSNGVQGVEPLRKLPLKGLQSVWTSLYGTESTHDEFVMKSGSWKRTLLWLAELARLEVPFGVNFTVTKSNIVDIDAFLYSLRPLGPSFIRFLYLCEVGRGEDLGQGFTPREWLQLREAVQRSTGPLREDGAVVMFMNGFVPREEAGAGIETGRARFCEARKTQHRYKVAVDPGGNVYPCWSLSGDPRYRIGHILTSTWSDTTDLLQKKLDEHGVRCDRSECSCYELCEGGCLSLSLNGRDRRCVDPGLAPICPTYYEVFGDA